MLLHLPDMKRVECLHKHMRDTQQAGGRQVISNVARMRACIDSGVLEESGLKHFRVTRKMFFEHWRKRRRTKTAWRFRSGRMNMGKNWTKIMLKKTWASPTPEKFRVCLAGWAWARRYYRMAAPRPKLGDARLPHEGRVKHKT